MKKFVSLLIVLLMVLSLSAVPASADGLVVDTCILKEADDAMINNYSLLAVNPEAPFVDADGKEVGTGEEGCICVMDVKNNPPTGLFTGYYHNPEMTKEKLLGDYYNTCDMAWRDSEGYYWFVGRNDDVIKCSGYRIGPFEVESALIEHDAVVECAITGVPDPVRGQVVKATIVLKKGYRPTDDLKKELQDHVKRSTAPYKYPRVIEFVDELPKTFSGKIKRAQIRHEDEEVMRVRDD